MSGVLDNLISDRLDRKGAKVYNLDFVPRINVINKGVEFMICNISDAKMVSE